MCEGVVLKCEASQAEVRCPSGSWVWKCAGVTGLYWCRWTMLVSLDSAGAAGLY